MTLNPKPYRMLDGKPIKSHIFSHIILHKDMQGEKQHIRCWVLITTLIVVLLVYHSGPNYNCVIYPILTLAMPRSSLNGWDLVSRGKELKTKYHIHMQCTLF